MLRLLVALPALVLGCADPGQSNPAVRRCVAPEGLGSPRSIAQTVELLDALPDPVDLPCVLESLDRPLYIELTSSPFSAQPAKGERSPRVFLFQAGLVLSVAIDGNGAKVLEFAESVDAQHSIKAELELPIERPLTAAAPYLRVQDDDGTICGLCHVNEEVVRAIDDTFAYSSQALRPRDKDVVELDLLREEHRNCDANAEPDRCAALVSFFEFGRVEHRAFPSDLPPFF